MSAKKPYTKFPDDDRKQPPKDKYKPFSTNLDYAIKNSYLTEEELSKKTGIGTTSLSQYRNGIQYPRDPQKLVKLADALDVSIDDLLGRKRIFDEFTSPDDENSVYYLGDQLGLTAEGFNRFRSFSAIEGGKCSKTLDLLFKNDRFTYFLVKAVRSRDLISKNKQEIEALEKPVDLIKAKDKDGNDIIIKSKRDTPIDRIDYLMDQSYYSVLATIESLKPVLLDVLGYNSLTKTADSKKEAILKKDGESDAE